MANKHVTATTDALLAAVSNVLINHVAILIIDEIERVANDSRKGITLINYLTQLVNQSNIAICFVGNESSNKYFESKEYLSRRTIGISIGKMDYDEYYFNFVRILFNYYYHIIYILTSCFRATENDFVFSKICGYWNNSAFVSVY